MQGQSFVLSRIVISSNVLKVDSAWYSINSAIVNKQNDLKVLKVGTVRYDL